MVVYLDLLILENFIVNFFLVYITAQTIKSKLSIKYGLIASFLGSLYVITILYPSLTILTLFPFKILVAVLIVFIAFRKINLFFLIKVTLIYLLYSMVVAGMYISVEYSFLPINLNEILGSSFPNLNYKLFLLTLMIVYVIIHRIVVFIKDRKTLSQLIYSVDIILKKDEKRITAFLDTGNELREPATNLPVMIVEKEIFSDIDLGEYDKFYIPYKVVNGATGRLIGIRPECVKIDLNGEMQKRDVIVAFCEDKLNNLKDYHALLSRGII